jgi:hypothetical protein
MEAIKKGSMEVRSKISGMSIPARRASKMANTRYGLGSSRPAWTSWASTSSEAMAFNRLSVNVLPIAMTSPTECILVVSLGTAPGNFSNAKRGTLVTT